MRHFTVLKAWKHTGLAKLDSSMQAYGKEQGPQGISCLISHHSFVLAINNMAHYPISLIVKQVFISYCQIQTHFHFGHYTGNNEKVLTNNFLVMNALLKVCKPTHLIQSREGVRMCLLANSMVSSKHNSRMICCCILQEEYHQPGQTSSASPGCESRWETGKAKIHPGRWGVWSQYQLDCGNP